MKKKKDFASSLLYPHFMLDTEAFNDTNEHVTASLIMETTKTIDLVNETAVC